jgi:signal peptidase I
MPWIPERNATIRNLPGPPTFNPPSRKGARGPLPGGTAYLLALLALFVSGAVTLQGIRAAASATLAVVVALLLTLTVVLGRRLVWATVQGTSMSPTYANGDRVLVRRGNAVHVGDVVVIEKPDADLRWTDPPIKPGVGRRGLATRAWMIKRVAAGPGDPIPRWNFGASAGLAKSPRSDGAEFAGQGRLPGDHVPEGMLILIGDNADASFDSREIGFFPADRVLGTPLRM